MKREANRLSCGTFHKRPALTPGEGTVMAKPTPTEHRRDKTLEDSFPASDPPANSGITGTGAPDRASRDRSIDERPTGTPNSDRHATETAHQWENEDQPRAKR
jgi:hypothetical protein